MPGDTASDAGLSTGEEMGRSLREFLNKICVDISNRFSHLRQLESRLDFLCNAESVVNQSEL